MSSLLGRPGQYGVFCQIAIEKVAALLNVLLQKVCFIDHPLIVSAGRSGQVETPFLPIGKNGKGYALVKSVFKQLYLSTLNFAHSFYLNEHQRLPVAATEREILAPGRAIDGPHRVLGENRPRVKDRPAQSLQYPQNYAVGYCRLVGKTPLPQGGFHLLDCVPDRHCLPLARWLRWQGYQKFFPLSISVYAGGINARASLCPRSGFGVTISGPLRLPPSHLPSCPPPTTGLRAMERIALTFSSRDNNNDELIAIALGTGIATVYSRTPSLIAQSMASLDVISGGRAILGLDSSGRIVIEDWHGVPFDHPVARTREYIEIIRMALAGWVTLTGPLAGRANGRHPAAPLGPEQFVKPFRKLLAQLQTVTHDSIVHFIFLEVGVQATSNREGDVNPAAGFRIAGAGGQPAQFVNHRHAYAYASRRLRPAWRAGSKSRPARAGWSGP